MFDARMSRSFATQRYNPYMDMSLGVWVGDLDPYAQRLAAGGVSFLTLGHKDDSGRQLFSIIIHAPHTQAVVELISDSPPHGLDPTPDTSVRVTAANLRDMGVQDP